MLYLHQSNHIEKLFDALMVVLDQEPPSVFIPETIVVEEIGMSRWLSRRIAEHQGIAANLEFPLPAGFVWKLLSSQLDFQQSAPNLNKATMLWYVMRLLPELRSAPGFEVIDAYLKGADVEMRLYQLSKQIADLFDQYLIYRHDMILKWQAGESTDWQAQLWRAMRGLTQDPHWGELIEQFSASIQRSGFKHGNLPARITLFAINSLSPGYLELLNLTAEHIDIHVFVVNPSYHYWGDIASAKDKALLRQRWRQQGRPDVSELYDEGNPLLASLGKPCRDFVNQWQSLNPDEHDYFSAPTAKHLLAQVQSDILNLQARGSRDIPMASITPDASLEVHSCHSPMREIQVLHDRLLGLFDPANKQALAKLQPHEIVVAAPDINQYSAAIEAVFGAASEAQHIPYSVANQSLQSQPIIETLLQWLLLKDQRFEAPSVLSWLELAAVKKRLRLPDDAIDRIRQWINESGIRWGLDAAHKQALGLPANEHNTWRFGLRRLFLGYAMDHDTELFHHYAPHADIQGSEAIWLGQLQLFIESLARLRQEFCKPATGQEWQARINRIIEQLFDPDPIEQAALDDFREQLTRVVSAIKETGFDRDIEAQVLHKHLSAVVSAASQQYGLLIGRVTFCNMVAVRALPFRVLCLLGMSDDVFPRNQQPLGFDLIAEQPRPGDRSLRNDDRNLFLQALLSAREILHISYIGRSQQDNSERLPSVVVTELLDYVEQGYVEEGHVEEDGTVDKNSLRKKIHIEHPLQPFSQRNFDAGSYASQWKIETRESPAFCEQQSVIPQEKETARVIRLDELSRFLANPSRHFLKNTLGLELSDYSDSIETNERFELDGLQAYPIKVQLLEYQINHNDSGSFYDLANARGELPHGESGRVCLQKYADALAGQGEILAQLLSEGTQEIDLQITINDVILQGRITQLNNQGALRYRATSLKSEDQIRLWIEHLALCASAACADNAESLHVGSDKIAKFIAIEAETARQLLADLLTHYWSGLQRALPVFSKSSLAYVDALESGKEHEEAMQRAGKAWFGDPVYNIRGDSHDPWIALAFRDQDALNHEFCELAKNLFLPLLATVIVK